MRKLVINLTNRCNFRCAHCFREGATREDLPLELLARQVPEWRRLGLVQIALTGGEPCLHPQFAQVLALLAGAGFKLGLVTNGWHWERYLALVAPHRASIAYLAVSLDAHLACEHDRLRRRGSFARANDAIDGFRNAGYAVNVSHIVSRRTASHLLAFGNFVKDRGVCVNVGRVVATPGNGDWQPDARQRQDIKVALGLLRRQLGPRLGTTSSLGLCEDLVFCTNFRDLSSLALRYDGAVLFCCDCVTSNAGAVLGNVHVESFAAIVARFPAQLARVLEARMTALLEGDAAASNDCDFCNATLAAYRQPQQVTARRPRAALQPAPTVNAR